MGMTFEGFSILGAVVFGILFGFGFAIGGWIWASILAAFARLRQPKA